MRIYNNLKITNMETIKFSLNFGGFYDSIYSYIVDDILFNEVEEGYLTENQVYNIDYKHLFNEMSKYIYDVSIDLFVDIFNNEGLSVSSDDFNFVCLDSPKYYNYRTDEIVTECNNTTVMELKKEFNKHHELFTDFVNHESKSRGGFISFYEGIEEVESNNSVYMRYLTNYLISSVVEDYRYETTEYMDEIIYNNLKIKKP